MISNCLNKLYIRQVLTLTAGTTFAQAIPILVSPILTRFYSPDEFALLALYLAVVSIFSVLATARYEMAIVLADSDIDSINIVALSLIIAFIVSALSFLLVFLFNENIASKLGNKKLGDLLYFVPLSIFATATYRTLSYWTNRKTQYKRMAIAKVSQTVATATTNIIGGFFSSNGGWLIFGEIIGHSAGAISLTRKMISDGYSFHVVNRNIMLQNAKKYSDFPKINSIHALVDSLQSSGIIFIMSVFFGGISLGLYSLTMRVLTAPVGVIGSSIAQVFYQKASRTYNDGNEVYSLLVYTTKRLALVSFPFFLALVYISPDLFAIVFGEKWKGAGDYARILIPWLAIHFVITPVSQMPLIFGKQRTSFIFGLIGNIIMLLSISYGGYVNNIIVGLIILSGCMVVHLSVYFLWILHLAKAHSENIQVNP